MAFIYFEDTEGDFSIINDKQLIFIDISKDKDVKFVKMKDGFSAEVKNEMFVVDDIESAIDGVEILKQEKALI